MIDIFVNFFTALGIAMVAVFISFTIQNILDRILDKVQLLYYQHKTKHRFDKEPKAECYCIDCANWYRDEEAHQSGYCTYNGQHVPEEYFCKYATVRKGNKND